MLSLSLALTPRYDYYEHSEYWVTGMHHHNTCKSTKVVDSHFLCRLPMNKCHVLCLLLPPPPFYFQRDNSPSFK